MDWITELVQRLAADTDARAWVTFCVATITIAILGLAVMLKQLAKFVKRLAKLMDGREVHLRLDLKFQRADD